MSEQPKWTAQHIFTVRTVPYDFIAWITSYGAAYQPDQLDEPTGLIELAESYNLYHSVSVRDGLAGYLAMKFSFEDGTHLTVTMDVMTQINVIGRLTPGTENPFASDVHTYVDNLIDAIARKYGATA